MFEPFQQYVSKAAKSYGVGTEVEAAKICQTFRGLIPEIFKGKEELAKQHVEPAHFKNKVLVIDVETPGWAQEVIVRKPKIIEEMNKKAGEEVIKNLRTRLKA